MIGNKYENGGTASNTSSLGEKYDSGYVRPASQQCREGSSFRETIQTPVIPSRPVDTSCYVQDSCQSNSASDLQVIGKQIVEQVTSIVSNIDVSSPSINISALASLIAQQVIAALPGPAAMTESFSVSADSVNVVSTVETTILTQVAPRIWYIDNWLVGAQPAARYKLKINGVVKATVITSVAQSTEDIPFDDTGIKVLSGQTITVTGYHEDILNKPMSTTVSGHYFP